MLTLRKSVDRGVADHGWLKSQHSFSFADYYDPEHMGFGTLRVINEDHIAAGKGFGSHPHRDMEIITYVLEGALKHKDSMGNEAIILPGEVQHMSAGTGVVHSEFNPSADTPTHLLQIWILPNQEGIMPKYGQKSFDQQITEKKFVLVASEKGREGSISIQQDADLYVGRIKKDEKLDYNLHKNRLAWIQVIKGKVQVNEKILESGDAVSARQEEKLNIRALQNGEFLLFDLTE